MLLYYSKSKRVCPKGEPLMRIPLDQIESVQWVNLPDQDTLNQNALLGTVDLLNTILKEQDRKLYCFEVKLRSEYEDLYLLNSINESLVKKQQEKLAQQEAGKQEVKGGRGDVSFSSICLQRISNALQSAVKMTAHQVQYPTQTQSSAVVRLEAGNVSVKIESSEAKLEDPQEDYPTEIVITRRVGPSRSYLHSRKRSNSVPGSQAILRTPRMNRVVQGHAVAVRDRSQGKPRDRFLEDSSILDKSFGKIDPENMSGAAATTSPSLTRSWSAR